MLENVSLWPCLIFLIYNRAYMIPETISELLHNKKVDTNQSAAIL